MNGRTLVRQTGNIPPISSVQTQQCHLVGFPHITKVRTDLSGSSMGSSWCFDSGRMGFALSSMITLDHNSFLKRKYQTPTFFCMRLWCLVVTHSTLGPSFDQRQTSFPHGISCKHGASWACPSRYDSSTLCMSSQWQRNQIEQIQSEKR